MRFVYYYRRPKGQPSAEWEQRSWGHDCNENPVDLNEALCLLEKWEKASTKWDYTLEIPQACPDLPAPKGYWRIEGGNAQYFTFKDAGTQNIHTMDDAIRKLADWTKRNGPRRQYSLTDPRLDKVDIQGYWRKNDDKDEPWTYIKFLNQPLTLRDARNKIAGWNDDYSHRGYVYQLDRPDATRTPDQYMKQPGKPIPTHYWMHSKKNVGQPSRHTFAGSAHGPCHSYDEAAKRVREWTETSSAYQYSIDEPLTVTATQEMQFGQEAIMKMKRDHENEMRAIEIAHALKADCITRANAAYTAIKAAKNPTRVGVHPAKRDRRLLLT